MDGVLRLQRRDDTGWHKEDGHLSWVLIAFLYRCSLAYMCERRLNCMEKDEKGIYLLPSHRSIRKDIVVFMRFHEMWCGNTWGDGDWSCEDTFSRHGAPLGGHRIPYR